MAQLSTVYIIGVKDPKSDNEKNYKQEVIFTSSGFNLNVSSTLPTSAPRGLAGTILTDSIVSFPPDTPSLDLLANLIISKTKNAFENVGIAVNLVVVSVVNPLPPPAPPPTPQQIETQRAKEEAINADNAQKVIPVDAAAINNANTNKPKGTAKLGIIITNLGKKIIVSLIPIAINMVRQFITEIVENEITKAKQKATTEQQKIQDQINTLDAKRKGGTKGLDTQIGALTAKKEAIPLATKAIEDNLRAQLTNFGSFSFAELPKQIPPILKTVFASGCPNPNSPTIRKIITTRNGLVTSLNTIGTQLNRLTQAITGLSTFIDITSVILSVLGVAQIVVGAVLEAFVPPLVPPGILTAKYPKLETLIRKALFTTTGEARIPKIAASIAAAAIPIAIINIYIQQIVAILSALDIKLKQCVPNQVNDLTPLSDTIVSIAAQQTLANQTINETTYNGFLIEIETVPYTPTVNRYRAVGKNQSGITLVQTDLSFTLEPQILINELKLIIDKDNLKAY
jgi:hypothetical protein